MLAIAAPVSPQHRRQDSSLFEFLGAPTTKASTMYATVPAGPVIAAALKIQTALPASARDED
jgi:hypothetical protein